MPASPSNGRQRKTGSVGSATLQAARNGSLVDLVDLAENIDTAPARLLTDALELFLEHLISRRILHASRSKDELYPRVSASLTGISSLIVLHNCKKTFIKPESLYSEWPEIIDTLIPFFEDARSTENTYRMSLVAKFAKGVLDHVMALVLPTDGAFSILGQEKSQMLFYSIWLHNWADTKMGFECAGSLSVCLKMGTRPHDCLLETAGGPSPAKTVIDLAVQRMYAVVRKDAPSAREEILEASQCSALANICDDPQHELTKALFKSDALHAIMRFLRILVNRSTKSAPGLFSASSCFFFLRQIFDFRRETIHKAIKKGLIAALCYFMPLVERRRAVDEQTYEHLQYILTESLPSELVYNNTIAAMANAMRRIPAEKRKLMRQDTLGKDWSALEVHLVDRFATLRIHTFRQRLVSCHTCGKLDLKTALKKCSRCEHVLYCSKECQALDWKSFGHKRSCGGEVVNTVAKRRRFTDIVDLLASHDAQRLFVGAVTQTLGSLHDFNPSKHLIKINYSLFPVKFEVMELSEFLKTQPTGKNGLHIHKAALTLAKQRETPQGPFRVICAKTSRKGLESFTAVDSINLDPIAMHTTELPGGLRRKLPRAAVQVVARTSNGQGYHEKKPKVEPKVDGLDFLLSGCGSTLDDFWQIRGFDDIVVTWLKQMNNSPPSSFTK